MTRIPKPDEISHISSGYSKISKSVPQVSQQSTLSALPTREAGQTPRKLKIGQVELGNSHPERREGSTRRFFAQNDRVFRITEYN